MNVRHAATLLRALLVLTNVEMPCRGTDHLPMITPRPYTSAPAPSPSRITPVP